MGPLWCTPELWKESLRLAEEFGIGIHTHVAETRSEIEEMRRLHGKSPAEFLYDLGVLGSNVHAIHSVWLSDKEIKMLKRTGTHVVHCPVSNMYLASGVAPIPQMIKEGVNVALGSDGPASNNTQDLFECMKATVCLQKAASLNPTVLASQQALEMATVNGAKALGVDKELGSLEKGKIADIIVVDLKKPHISPVHNPSSSLVYCAKGSDVDTVIIDGQIVMEDRRLMTINEYKAIEKAQRSADKLATTLKKRQT
jgi:5-methylthioadenosine/S-adenosylhomocysteine deaminase